MFKSPRAVNPVSFLLNQIYHYDALNGFSPSPRKFQPPTVVCVAQDTAAYYAYLKLSYDPWQKCREPSRRRPPQAFYADGTPFIFICPSFFGQEVTPTPSRGNEACPKVVDNEFTGNVDVFYRDYQVFTLLYQLIRFYLGRNGLNRRTHPKEVFDWNLCVGCSAVTSILNPTNILLYIASKSNF